MKKHEHAKKKYVAGAIAALLVAAGALAIASPASAAEPGSSADDPIVVGAREEAPEDTVWTAGEVDPSACTITDTGVLATSGSAETSHPEYRFRSRAELYGSKELKDITGYDFVDGGTTTVNGMTIAGRWVESAGVHRIADVIVNVVWGRDGAPDSVLGDGTVNLSAFGGPSVVVHYYAQKVSTSEGYTDWGPWSAWSTTDPGPSGALIDVESRSVGNGDAEEATTTYYALTRAAGDECTPTTEDPSTEDPGTDEPTTDEPTTDEPTTDEPTTDEPTTEDPGTDEPGTDEPSTDDPGTDEPSTEDPSTEDPGTDEPSTDDPSTEDPGTEEPARTQGVLAVHYVAEASPAAVAGGELAATGGTLNPFIPIGGALLVALGGLGVVLGMRARTR